MSLPRKRLTIPSTLVVAMIAAPNAGCTTHAPSPDDVISATDAADSASDALPPISDACAALQCLNGPIDLCSPDDAGVLACPLDSCTAAYTLDGGYLGRQCYGECVTSTQADGATLTGYC